MSEHQWHVGQSFSEVETRLRARVDRRFGDLAPAQVAATDQFGRLLADVLGAAGVDVSDEDQRRAVLVAMDLAQSAVLIGASGGGPAAAFTYLVAFAGALLEEKP